MDQRRTLTIYMAAFPPIYKTTINIAACVCDLVMSHNKNVGDHSIKHNVLHCVIYAILPSLQHIHESNGLNAVDV